LQLAGGYKYIDPWFYTPGYWGRIGFWLNPTNIKGPMVSAAYSFGDSLSVKAGAEFLKGASHDYYSYLWPEDEINKITAGVRYNLSKTANVTVDWEGDFVKYNYGEGDVVHPSLNILTIGTGYNLTSNTVLKLGYEIGDFNGKGAGLGGMDIGNRFNYNVFTTQVAVKF